MKASQKNKDTLAISLKEQRSKERLNQFGIDEDAVLTVRVVEARDLVPMDYTGKSDPYCVLKFGNEVHKTHYVA